MANPGPQACLGKYFATEQHPPPWKVISVECSSILFSYQVQRQLIFILGHQNVLIRWKRIQIIQNVLLEHSRIKLEISNGKLSEKKTLKYLEIKYHISQ